MEHLFSHRRRLLLVILLLAFGLRIYRLGGQSLWWDEIMTVARSTMTVPELLENLFESRTHLPIYFFLIQAWGHIGRSEFIIRYFSVVCAVLTIPVIYRTGRLIAGYKVGLLAAFLLAVSPFHIWYAQEARMYTFLALTTLTANWFLLRLFKRDDWRDWVGYSLAMLLTLGSHYLGVLILIAHYVFFSFHYRQNKQRFRRWFISASVAGAAFTAWFLAVYFTYTFSQAAIGWIKPAHWYEPVLTLLTFSLGRTFDLERPFFYLAFFATLLPILATLYLLRRTQATLSYDRLAARLLWAWLAVPLILITLISLDWSIPDQRYIYMDRYIISLLPAFILLAAWGIAILARQQWAKHWLPPVFMGLILLPTAVSLANLYFDPAYGREAWKTAVSQITSDKQTGDILLLTRGQILPLAYYENEQLPRVILPSSSEIAEIGVEDALSQALASELAALNLEAQRVWIIRSFDNANPHGFPQIRNQAVLSAPLDPYETWLMENYLQIEHWYFPGIRLNLYDLQRNE